MSSLLICSTPAEGHIIPLMNVVRSLVAAGDRVRFLTGSRWQETVEASGAEFLPLPDEADWDLWEVDPVAVRPPELTGPKAVSYDLINIFIKPLGAQWRAVQAALAAEHTDAVLSEPLFVGIVPLLNRPRSERPLLATLGIVPMALRSRDTAPFGLGVPPLRGPVGRIRNAVLQQVAAKAIFADVDRAAQSELVKVGETYEGRIMEWLERSDLHAQFSVPSFEYPRSDLRAGVHFVGPVSRGGGASTPVPSWWDDVLTAKAAGIPIVHVTQGTVSNGDLEQLVLPTVRGLADESVLVVATTGGRELDVVPNDLPSNARIAAYLDYDALFPLVDVVVTNGGYGGVHFALQNGVPIVVAGQTEDKTEVSARVGWAGVGINLRTNTPTPAVAANAVRKVLATPGYREAARRIGADIAASPGPDAIHGLIQAAVSQPA